MLGPWRCIARATSWARGGRTGGTPRRNGSPRPSEAWPWRTGSRPCFGVRTSRKTTPIAWHSPRCAATRSGLPPPPASGTRLCRPIPSSATIARAGTATTPPAPPPWPPPGKARMSPSPMTWRRQSSAARPSTGSRPSWRLDQAPRIRAAPGTRVIVQTLDHWKQDTDLAGIREADGLAKLPADEQKVWRAFWADVDSLLKRAGGPR